MMDRIDTESVRFLFLVRPAEGEQAPQQAAAGRSLRGRNNSGFSSSSSGASSGSRKIFSFRLGRRRPRRRSRCEPVRKSDATIRVLAALGRNIRSAMGRTLEVKLGWFFPAGRIFSRIEFHDRLADCFAGPYVLPNAHAMEIQSETRPERAVATPALRLNISEVACVSIAGR